MKCAPVFQVFGLTAVIVLATALTLSGCSFRQENKVLNSGPDGITIEYDTRYPTMAGVDADEHCAKFGKVAQRAETTEPNSMQRVTHSDAAVAVFACVDAS